MAEKAIEVPVALELADSTCIRTETTIGDRDLQARVRREMRLTKPEWDALEAYWHHHSGKRTSLFEEERKNIAEEFRRRYP